MHDERQIAMILELVTSKAPAGADWEAILADERTTVRAGAPIRRCCASIIS
jgi:hypothetical protein